MKPSLYSLFLTFTLFTYFLEAQNCGDSGLDSLLINALKIDDDNERMDSMLSIADTWHEIGNGFFNDEKLYLKAICQYKPALRIRRMAYYKGRRDSLLLLNIIKCYRNIGLSWFELGYNNKAEAYLDSCLNKQLEFNQYFDFEVRKAQANHAIGNVYGTVGELKKAKDHLIQALNYYKKLNAVVYQAFVYNDLSALHIPWEEPDSVLYYAEKALSIDDNDKINRLINKSAGYEMKDSLEKALNIHELIIRQKNDEENPDRNKSLNNKAIIYSKLGRFEEGLDALMRLLK